MEREYVSFNGSVKGGPYRVGESAVSSVLRKLSVKSWIRSTKRKFLDGARAQGPEYFLDGARALGPE